MPHERLRERLNPGHEAHKSEFEPKSRDPGRGKIKEGRM